MVANCAPLKPNATTQTLHARTNMTNTQRKAIFTSMMVFDV
jgi:hypothetical protein